MLQATLFKVADKFVNFPILYQERGFIFCQIGLCINEFRVQGYPADTIGQHRDRFQDFLLNALALSLYTVVITEQFKQLSPAGQIDL